MRDNLKKYIEAYKNNCGYDSEYVIAISEIGNVLALARSKGVLQLEVDEFASQVVLKYADSSRLTYCHEHDIWCYGMRLIFV